MYVDLKLDFFVFFHEVEFQQLIVSVKLDMKMGLEFHATNDKGIEKKGRSALWPKPWGKFFENFEIMASVVRKNPETYFSSVKVPLE